LMGSSDLYEQNGRKPVASVNFITAHDGFTMNDLVSYNEKHNEANKEGNNDGANDNRSWNCGVEGPTSIHDVNELRERQMRNLFSTLLMSQGIPMICAGDEVMRTQHGNNNAYCQDNAISWMSWDYNETQRDMFDFVSKLIHLRLHHPVLHRRRFFTGRSNDDDVCDIPQVEWLDHNGTVMDMEDWSNTHALSVMIYLNGSDIPETDWYGTRMVDNDFILIFNAHYEPITFTLPDKRYGEKWKLIVDTYNPKGPELLYEAGFNIVAQSRSFLLLMSEHKPEH
ncbi:glycogen debranching enzyme, partial [Bifidobacteriaceae bacterium WP012]